MYKKWAICAGLLSVCLLFGCGTAADDEDEKKIKRPRKTEVVQTEAPEATSPGVTPARVTFAPSATPVVQKSGEKEAFLQRAADIEAYDAEKLKTAMSQMDINREAGIVYEKWDTLLNDVWKYLIGTLSESEYDVLLKEELAWIDEKEAAMEAASQEWKGGSGEPMARFGEGITYTRSRCYELINMIP